MKPFKFLLLALTLMVALFAASPARATITVLNYWHLGENDPGAGSGGFCANTVDEVGGDPLTNTTVGGPYPIYTSGVSTAASADTGSTLALALTNSEYLTGALATSLADNFGIECWVNPGTTAAGGQILAYNGLRGNGWGLYQNGTQFEVLYGGRTFFGSALATAGAWTHLALVRNNGVAILYTNGVPASTNSTAPITPSGGFTVGGDAAFGEYFTGAIDEVRVFTFTAGAFSTNDLLLNSTHLFVSNTNDDNRAGSLRQIIAQAASGDLITFIPGLSGQTITLTNGQIYLGNLTIDASALPGGIIISGNNDSPIFIASYATVVLNSLTLANGTTTFLVNSNTVNLLGVIVNNTGNFTLTQCTLSGNSGNSGNGVIANFGGTLMLTNCTLSGNSGFAIFNEAGRLTLTQCTVSSNSNGISIFDRATLTLNNSIVAGNTNNGGLDTYSSDHSTNVFLGANIVQVFTDDGSGTSTGTVPINADPLLAPPGNYGGPTRTMPPLAGSPAIDAGNDSVTNFLATDQRGYPRLSGAHVDIGAVEVNAVVSSSADNGTNTSLRQIIRGSAPGQTNTFAPGLSGKTITLANGQIVLDNNVTIDGSALMNGIAINGNARSRIFTVNSGVTAVLNALTITNGSDDPGGGIDNNGTLTVNKSTLAGNLCGSGTYGGGAIYNNATLTVNNCTITGNQDATLNFSGGGIGNFGALTVNNSTITSNQAVNISDGGGGIGNYGRLTVNNSTIFGNQAPQAVFGGGGIDSYAGALTLTNTIVCSNTAPSGPNINGGYSGANNLVDTNPLLEPLGNYGGFTQTMPPLPGSPAIDAGTDSVTNFLTADQIGNPRRSGLHVDIGAMEIQIPVLLVSNTNDDNRAGSLRQVVSQAINSYYTTITFTNTLSGEAIVLTNGPIVPATNINVDGSALPNGIQINGNHSSRIFDVASGTTVTLNTLTLTNGYAGAGNSGGAIANSGVLNLNRCALMGNTAPSVGGAIDNSGGTLTLTACTLANNSASASGAIQNYANCAMIDCTVEGNTCPDNGGAIDNDFSATLSLVQCTFSGNQAGGVGGAVDNYLSTLFVTNSILAGNTAGGGGDIYNWASSTVTIEGTNLVQSFSNSGTNNGSGSILVLPPMLSSLGYYGGPTETMPPMLGSPAIDGGNTADASGIATDQRGYPRVSGARVDIGAVETQIASTQPALEVLNTSADGVLGGTNMFQFRFTNLPGGVFTAFATTNLTVPLSLWSNLGPAIENPVGSGQFQFTDLQDTNYRARFYNVRSP